MRNNRIPERWLQWIKAFCSNYLASMVLNSKESSLKSLPFPGVPQGSLLSPMLYLFFNANLVEREITDKEELVAFIDNYIVWVIGNYASENRLKLLRIMNRHLYRRNAVGPHLKKRKRPLFTLQEMLDAQKLS